MLMGCLVAPSWRKNCLAMLLLEMANGPQRLHMSVGLVWESTLKSPTIFPHLLHLSDLWIHILTRLLPIKAAETSQKETHELDTMKQPAFDPTSTEFQTMLGHNKDSSGMGVLSHEVWLRWSFCWVSPSCLIGKFTVFRFNILYSIRQIWQISCWPVILSLWLHSSSASPSDLLLSALVDEKPTQNTRAAVGIGRFCFLAIVVYVLKANCHWAQQMVKAKPGYRAKQVQVKNG